MVKVECFDLIKAQTFVREYDNYLDARKFIIKCKYSKKVAVTSIESDNPTEMEYLWTLN